MHRNVVFKKNMTSHLTTEERVKIILLHAKFENFEEVRYQWKNHFPSQPPSPNTIRSLVKKFEETRSVHDRDRSGRSCSVVTEDAVKKVEEIFIDNSNTSIRVGARELETSKSSFYREARQTSFHPYKRYTVVELNKDDFDKRDKFCTTFLTKLEQERHLLDGLMRTSSS